MAMNKALITEALEVAAGNFDYDGEYKKADETRQQAAIIFSQFTEGIKYALAELASLYDGITETDLWAEYMNEGESN
jgi:nitrogen fixation/metabolism regulation signal transduction histidine kinase